MASVSKPKLYWVPLIQVLLLIVGSFIISVVQPQILISAISGGLIGIIPQFYFSLNAYRYSGAPQTRWIVRSFNRGESGKFLLTLIGFALVFSIYKPVNVTVLFVVYILMVLIQIGVTAKVVNLRH